MQRLEIVQFVLPYSRSGRNTEIIERISEVAQEKIYISKPYNACKH